MVVTNARPQRVGSLIETRHLSLAAPSECDSLSIHCWKLRPISLVLGWTPRGCTTPHTSEKSAEKGVLRFVEGALQKVLRRVLEGVFLWVVLRGMRGGGFSRRCLESPVGECEPLGVYPISIGENVQSHTTADIRTGCVCVCVCVSGAVMVQQL